MKLSELFPSTDEFAGLQGIEQRLQMRRYKSWWSLVLAIVILVAQVALTVGGSHTLKFLERIPEPIRWGIPILAGLVWVLGRYTGFLFKQSQEPFRYTFCILDFKPVAGTPGERWFQFEVPSALSSAWAKAYSSYFVSCVARHLRR
jgi:hypothetical protein